MKAAARGRWREWLWPLVEGLAAAGLLVLDFGGGSGGRAAPLPPVIPRPVAAATVSRWLASPPGTVPTPLELAGARLPAATVARIAGRNGVDPAWVAETFAVAAMDRRYHLAAAVAVPALSSRLGAAAVQAAALARKEGLSGRVRGVRVLTRAAGGPGTEGLLLAVGFGESIGGRTWPSVVAELAVGLKQSGTRGSWQVTGLRVLHERALSGPWTGSLATQGRG